MNPDEPTEQPIRARVPDHVAAGAFSTGVIVMTANTEFILDFVQNLGRPHQIVARVVMPHYVLPQLIDALKRNMELYRSRWGELPQSGGPGAAQLPWTPSGQTQPLPNQGAVQTGAPAPSDLGSPSQPAGPASSPGIGPTPESGTGAQGPAAGPGTGDTAGGASNPPSPTPDSNPGNEQNLSQGRQTTAQDIYDDLKIRDEILSGSYSNAVMIGHGPHEFSFDFITNFYPSSCVSARVFLAAGQIPRLYESLRGTWDQLRARQTGNPPNQPPPGQPPADGGPIA